VMISPERWDKLESLLHYLRPWIDRRSNRPLILLVVVSLGALFFPLACDLVPALYFRLPHPWRKLLEQSLPLAIGVAAFLRVWQLKPTDSWPAGPAVGDRGDMTAAARWIAWALRLGVISLAYPLMQNPDGLGFADWDFVLDKFEAARRTILLWGQFPWWNPWCRGGFPLAAEPQIGAVSMATPLVLALGTSIGLRLSAIFCLLIAVEGAYRLGWLWFREPWAAVAVASIYGLNGSVLINLSLGYVMVMSFCSVPWLGYFTYRLGRRFADALWLGFWMAFVVLNGIQYVSLYAIPFTAMIWVRALRVERAGRSRLVLPHTLAALGVFLLVCGWRLSTVFLVLLDDKRERVTYWDETPLTTLHCLLLRPRPGWNLDFSPEAGTTFASLACYVGPIVLLLAVASLLLGWRWWHAMTLGCFWLGMGSVRWYHPSSWIMDWPVFGSAHVVVRWRILGLLGLGLAAGSMLARWRASQRPAVRALAAILTSIIAVDFIVLGHQQLPLAFSVPPSPDLFPGPPVPDIVNVRQGLGFPCAMRGYGIIEGYEPMLSYRRNARTLRLAREDPAYRGEAWTDDGTIQPTFWSPNRLVFQVKPGQTVHINQNPSSWWWQNGGPAFPGRRCAELTEPFAVPADAKGGLVLEIHPRGLEFGIGLHVLGAILLAIGAVLRTFTLGPARTAEAARGVPVEDESSVAGQKADRGSSGEESGDRV
jgi:hypothetical protein